MNIMNLWPSLGLMFKNKKVPERSLLAFWDEINRNLEKYYVVEQRQFIADPFESEVFDRLEARLAEIFSGEFTDYGMAVRAFNQEYLAVKAYEAFYASSADRKTREHALVLHEKQEALERIFVECRPNIIFARDRLRRLMEKK
jgi:hypothetical protein